MGSSSLFVVAFIALVIGVLALYRLRRGRAQRDELAPNIVVVRYQTIKVDCAPGKPGFVPREQRNSSMDAAIVVMRNIGGYRVAAMRKTKAFVTAILPSGESVQATGHWLNTDWNSVNFNSGDTKTLCVAMCSEHAGSKVDPESWIAHAGLDLDEIVLFEDTREEDEPILGEVRPVPLPPNTTRAIIQVKLVDGNGREIEKAFGFILTGIPLAIHPIGRE